MRRLETGKLLRDAHALNPNTEYRNYTLWSEAERESEVPSPEAAEAYAHEFPSGPFILQADVSLAGFYDDLYKVIRLEQKGQRVDYKYECFKTHLKETSLAEQARQAQEAGVRYYQEVLKLSPDNAGVTERLNALREGRDDSGWSTCPD